MTAEQRNKRDLEDLRAIFSMREGARFFSMLLDLCGVFRLSYEAEDTHATAFREGQRNIGLTLLAVLEHVEPRALYRILEANKEREVNENNADGKSE